MNTEEKLSILEFMEKHNFYLINHYNAYALCTDIKDIGRVFLADSSLPLSVGYLSKELPIQVYQSPVFIGDIEAVYKFISNMIAINNVGDALPITPTDLGLKELRKSSLDIDLV